MENQEKWVALFKQVIGRVPSPAEFLAGKESGFDFKKIKEIAGLETLQVSQRENWAETNSIDEKQVLFNENSEIYHSTPKESTKWTKKKKTVVGISLVAILGLASGYVYLDQQTGSDISIEQFKEALKEEDYTSLASQLSSVNAKWTNANAKEFANYLKKQDNLEMELEKLANHPNDVYRDSHDNQLLGLEKKSDIFGLFTQYRVKTYPIEILANTNQEGLVLENKNLSKDKTLSLGSYPFVSQALKLTGKTEFGSVDSEILADVSEAQDNKLTLSVNAREINVLAKLPTDLSNLDNTKLFINKKEVATSLEKTIQVLENQTLAVYVQFTYQGKEYETETKEFTVDGDNQSINVDLTVSDQVKEQLNQAQKAKEEQERVWNSEKMARLHNFILNDWGPRLNQVYKEYSTGNNVNFYGLQVPDRIVGASPDMQPDFTDGSQRLSWSQTGLQEQGEKALVAVYSDIEDATNRKRSVTSHLYLFTIENGVPEVWITEQNQGNENNKLYFRVTQNTELRQFFINLVNE